MNIVSKKNLIIRLKKRKSLNRYDNFKLSFYDKVQKGYLQIAKSNPKSYKLIDSNLDQKKNEKLIKDLIDKLITWI